MPREGLPFETQLEIIKLRIKKLTLKAIATQLDLTYSQVRNICQKHDRGEISIMGIEAQLTKKRESKGDLNYLRNLLLDRLDAAKKLPENRELVSLVKTILDILDIQRKRKVEPVVREVVRDEQLLLVIAALRELFWTNQFRFWKVYDYELSKYEMQWTGNIAEIIFAKYGLVLEDVFPEDTELDGHTPTHEQVKKSQRQQDVLNANVEMTFE
jgi:hypothetical protein